MENQLYDDKVISKMDSTDKSMENNCENKSMIQLEATQLDMASTVDFCKGVLHIFLVKLGGKYIVRYICYIKYYTPFKVNFNTCLVVSNIYKYYFSDT